MNLPKNYTILLIFVVVPIIIAVYYAINTINSPRFSAFKRDSVILPGGWTRMYLNSLVNIKNSLVTFEIENIDAIPCPMHSACVRADESITFTFHKNKTVLTETDHIYTLKTIVSDYDTYAIVQLGTIFDTCNTPATANKCSLRVAERLQTVESCEKAVGVTNIQECKDIFYQGKSLGTKDKKWCESIISTEIKALCKK